MLQITVALTFELRTQTSVVIICRALSAMAN